jgi:predicted dehydrogenase
MKWGVLGCANIARSAVIPAILSVENSHLVAVASRHLLNAQLFAAKFNCIPLEGYSQLLDRQDIDAVYIPLPTGLHYEWVMKALEAGKHVLVEKSASATIEESTAMVIKAREKGLALVENFQFLHHSQHQYVKNMLAENEIGEIRSFRSSFGFPPFDLKNNIRYQQELGGGALLDSGAYALRATSFICGSGFEVRAAQLKNHDSFGVDWYGGAFLSNNETGLFSEIDFGFDNYYQCKYEIWGSNGRIVSTRAFTAKSDFSPSIFLEKNGETQEIVLSSDNHFINMIRHFELIVEQRRFETEWAQLLEQSRLISQLRKCAEASVPNQNSVKKIKD